MSSPFFYFKTTDEMLNMVVQCFFIMKYSENAGVLEVFTLF